MEIGHPEKFLALDGNRSSRPRVISPVVMSPETWVVFFFLFFFFTEANLHHELCW